MFGSQVLEVAIGLVLLYLLLSLLCSSIREGLEAWQKTRASDLERGIRELLQDREGTGLAKAVYEHPLVYGLYKGEYEPAKTTLEEFLIQRTLVRTYDAELIQTAAKFLHRTRGQYRIAELADACDLSVRQLERGFQQVIGASPRTFARTIRFQEAQRRLMFDPEVDLTELAYACGYFDQAHFIKDFKAFVGKTPTEYARQMRQMQEILKSKDVVFLQSSPRPGG